VRFPNQATAFIATHLNMAALGGGSARYLSHHVPWKRGRHQPKQRRKNAAHHRAKARARAKRKALS
jgi:hypothetical protein